MFFKSLIFINMWAYIQSAKILAVFPTPSISHQVVFRPLTQELARRGHEVTVITPDPAFPQGGAPANLEEIDVHDISYQSWQKFFQEVYKAGQSDFKFSELKEGLMMMAYIVQLQLQSPQVQKLLSDKNKKFDLIFVEAIMRVALGYSYIFKAPVILVSSLGAIFNNHHVMGSSTHPIIFPSALHKKTYNLTLYQKLNLLHTHYFYEYAHYFNEADENKLLQKIFGPNIPPLSELYDGINMLFINIHPIWADNQPVPPNVVYIGGIHQVVQRELQQDLKTYLDSSRHGVIYLSFGSNVLADMIPPNIIQIIVKVLSSLPYNILWKWDKDELPGRTENIRLSKWFPQSDLLKAIMRVALGYSYIFKAPVILVSSLGAIFNNHHVMGSSTHPIIFPSALHKKTYNLTLYQKLNLLHTHYFYEYAHYFNEADENKLLQKIFGPNIPPLSELYDGINMLFINIHPIWADNQPVPPNVVYIGGIHQVVQRELQQDLKTYLDSSRHGVIYLSFGSNVLADMIPPNIIQIIVKVLSSLPYNILWKWDKDELPGRTENIRLSKWFPQSDLLKHPKVKLFITQAGLQSTEEAIAAGVPLVAIPMLGDQWYNAEKYVKHGIGKMLYLETFAEDHFRNAVETVINNESYRKNIIKLREIMTDQPEPPLQRAIWWTEYLIRHGGAKHLRPYKFCSVF